MKTLERASVGKRGSPQSECVNGMCAEKFKQIEPDKSLMIKTGTFFNPFSSLDLL